jgi:alpha-1,2-glucosyltransferase
LGPKNYHTTGTVCRLQVPTVPPTTQLSCRYLLSVFLHRVFMFKCNLNLLRLTTTLTLFALPLVLTRLLGFHQRRRPLPQLAPSIEALVLSTFPIAWFFGFLYYTEVPSLVFVLCTVVAATQNKHWLAGLVRDLVCPVFIYAHNSRGVPS